METSLKTGFAQIFSCCPKNLSCPNFGGAAAPLAPPARTPMRAKDDFCSGATVGSEQQHNQDLREIYKVEQILEFITFYQNALCCEQLK